MAEFGMFEVDKDRRIVRGILVPWGEASRTNQTGNKPVKFKKGDVRVPRDVSVVGLNKQHDRYEPFGRLHHAEPVEAGLYAEFRIADTDEGDSWLDDHGDLVRLSPELRDIVRGPDGETATATLTGAALVTEGAFASAGLFSLDVEQVAEDTEAETTVSEDEPVSEPDDDKEEAVAEASASEVMLAGRGKTEPKKEAGMFASRRHYFKAADDIMGGRATVEQVQGFLSLTPGERGAFALNDVDYDGTDGVGAKMVQAQWLGEIPQPAYRQRFVPLFGSQNLTSLSLAGFKWGTKPAGATWNGNKSAISSNTPTITPVTETATRWAGGHDIAREHRDFGTPGFFESYEFWMRRSFEEWLDKTIVLTEALAGATDLEADDPTGLDIGAILSAIIDGAAAIVDAGLTPTSAVMDTNAWKSIAKVPQSDVLGYLNAQLSLTGEGRLDTFQLVPAPVGTVTADHVVVIARDAADVYTLPGSPIRAEALNIANGGIDIGFFGYGGFLIKDARGIQDVAPYTS